MQRAIGIRRGCPELSWGEACTLDVPEPSVLAICNTWQGRTIHCVHNLGSSPCEVNVGIALQEHDEVTELLADADYPPVTQGAMRLNAHGYRWLRVSRGLPPPTTGT